MSSKVFMFLVIIGCTNCFLFQQCFNQDSISCLQIQMYETAKRFFNKSTVQLVNGITVRTNVRQAKSLDEIEVDKGIMSSKDVEGRQIALENYIVKQVKHLWNSGSLYLNVSETSRSFINTLLNMNDTEGRAQDKKDKILLPLLIGIKLKFAVFAALAYMIIVVIAKKAVLAGTISLLIAGFIAIKNLIESHGIQSRLTPYHTGWNAHPSIWTSQQAALYEQELYALKHNSNENKNEKIFKN